MPASLLSRLTWIPLSEAASQPGLSKRRLFDLIDSDHVHATRRFTSSGREFVMVRRMDVEGLANTESPDMCLAEASSLLGMKRQRLGRLLPVICPEAKKSTVHGTPWLIPKIWIDGWQEKLSDIAYVKAIPSVAISLDHLLRYGPLNESRVATLLLDIEFGKFLPMGRDERLVGFSSLLFHRQQVLDQYESCGNALLPIPELADRLGVKQEVAYALVRLGLLEVSSYIAGRRQARGVSVPALEKFSRKYVFATDLAKSLCRSPRAVIEALTADGIELVAGPTKGNCRQAVYLRKDLDTVSWLQLDDLTVASRTIIWSLVKQMWVRCVPLFHRLHRRLAFEC